MFVTYLEENGFLCHDKKDIQIDPNRHLSCKVCHRHILDVNHHLTVDTLPMLSTFLAKCYAQWTGDVHVPCRLIIKDIPGIRSDSVEISYFNLVNAIKLLGTINQDFILCQNHHFDVTSTLKAKILENFIDYYMTMVENIEHEKEDVEKILKAVLKQMKCSFNTQDYNIFDYYFKVICPYIKTFDATVREETVNVDCPGEFFLHLSKNATEIRNHFSKYCLPFDVTYIMIYCFACHKNLDLVANFVFDLIGRLCTGYFDAPTPYQDSCKTLLQSLVSYKDKTPFYYVVRDIQNGEACTAFSLEFYHKFAKLQQLLMVEFGKAVATPSDLITKFAFTQSFPYVLFPNAAQYYGFMCMMGFATSKLNTKTNVNFEKGTCSNAREIFGFVESFTHRIQQFAEGTYLKVSEIKKILTAGEGSDQMRADIQKVMAGQDLNAMDEETVICLYPKVDYWTLDHFNLFISKDDVMFKQLFTKFMGLLVT